MLALYIHWPFCLSKCSYCDFNSYAISEPIMYDDWLREYIYELEFWAQKIGERSLKSIFFGGGTPSLMKPAMVRTVIDKAFTLWPTNSDIEITIEMNPTSVEAAKLRAFRDSGINRVSIGVQSLDDEMLKFLGRTHDSEQAKQSIFLAKSLFKNVSFDMIYGHSHHKDADRWWSELAQALNMAPDHLSLYQLMYSPGTKITNMVNSGTITPLSDEETAHLYEKTTEKLEEHGLLRYEVSNYAKCGYECQHNLAYWNYEDYLGIGPGAHSRLTISGSKVGFSQHDCPEKWLNSSRGKIFNIETLTDEERISEILLMGLRLKNGIPIAKVEKFMPPSDRAKFFTKKDALVDAGLLIDNPVKLTVAPRAFSKLDSIINFLA